MPKKKKPAKRKELKGQEVSEERNLDEIMGALLKVPPKKRDKPKSKTKADR